MASLKVWRRCGVAYQDRFKVQPLPDGHDGDTVVADGTGHKDAVAGPGGVDREAAPFRHRADPRGGDEDAVALAAVHDLGVAGDEGHAGFAAGVAHRIDDTPQIVQRQAFFEDERGREEERPRTAHGQVVHRPVHRQFADVAAGKEERSNDKRIRGDGDS